MAGGMMGGALTGGLEGGGKGALVGAGIGSALGAFGGWGVDKFGWQFGAGMLAAGAGVAGATNSWDSFAGGFVGGLCGAAVGSGIDSYFNDPISYQTPIEGQMPSDNKNWRMLGIVTTDRDAQIDANLYQTVTFYTKTRGLVPGLVRGGIQKIFSNSLASRQFAGYLRGAAEGNIWAHSEGTLTLAGAIKALNADGAKVQGLKISFNGPAISKSAANNLAQSIGAKASYNLNWADPIGAIDTINPVTQIIYGVLGMATGANFHSEDAYLK
jgi:hypothetical protein